MSLTLRDAQHLCWKSFRMINDRIAPDKGKEWTPFVTITELLVDSGRVAGLVKELEDEKLSEARKVKEELASSLSDLLYEVFVLGENYGIDVEETFLQTMNDRVVSNLH